MVTIESLEASFIEKAISTVAAVTAKATVVKTDTLKASAIELAF